MDEKRTLPAPQRQRLYRLMCRIYEVLNSSDWRVRLTRLESDEAACRRYGIPVNSVGTIDEVLRETPEIVVDFRKDIIPILVHECLHVIYEDLPEEDILSLERFVIDHMTPLQAKRVLQLASCALV